MTDPFNIYMTGVGGQGIGLLSQVLLRAVDHAGIRAIAVDTHGLAQRGGVVVSRIRLGEKAFSPLIMAHQSHLVLGMEVHEALRGASKALKKAGCLCYLNVAWQPLDVRLGKADPVGEADIAVACQRLSASCYPVDAQGIDDPRMQNMALIGTVMAHNLIPGVSPEHYGLALEDLLSGTVLEKNRAVMMHHGGTGS